MADAAAADPNRLFGDAQRAFAGGNAAGCLDLLERLEPGYRAHPDIAHLRALALKQVGRIEDAKAAFATAQRGAPDNPEIANNHANLLMQTGDAAGALPLYERAIALRAGYRDALFNRALALQALGRRAEALAALDAQIDSGGARVQSARGSLLLALGRHDEAAAAFDAALAQGPALPKALHGRARVALERGEAGASLWYRRARDAAGDDPDILLGLADALEAEGDPAGIALLQQAVAARPGWIEGMERLAQMRAEAGEADFASHYDAALAAGAADATSLRRSHAKMLAAADRFADALDVTAPLPDDAALRVTRAHYCGEAGRAAEGLRLLDGLPPGADAALIEGRLAMATGDFARAATALDTAVALAPLSIAAWAHCELLWRFTGDARAAWLSGQDGLVAARPLGLGAAELADTAALLRDLHRTQAFPIGQSLRGGTQTRGRLLLRQEPEIRRLKAALEAAVEDHLGALPHHDDRHPLLRHRLDPLSIAGSWSVRLTSSGYHVSHIHPEGVLSSACYIALPTEITDGETRAGWLEIGRPPATLNLALEPLHCIMPQPGRLALFPSFLYHGTRPFTDGERLTVAFDVTAA